MGAACREDYAAAMTKAYNEWIQGCVFTGYYDALHADLHLENNTAVDSFDKHAVYYTKNPHKWADVPLLKKRRPYTFRETGYVGLSCKDKLCAISGKQLSSLFSCFADVDGRRLLPSGGGKYPIEIYGLFFHVQGKLNEKIVYYNWESNSLSIIAGCPKWAHIQDQTGLLLEGEPSILFVFAAFPSRTISKYGERGGRFLLIEAGHYVQNLSLRVAYEGLGGVEAGGLFDEEMKAVLGLTDSEAIITLGYACEK